MPITGRKRKASEMSRAERQGYGRAPSITKAYRKRNQRTAGYLGIEKKFFDTSKVAAVTATTTTGAMHDPATVNCLNAMSEGSGESNREGRKISMHSLHLKGNVEITPQVNQTALDGACEVLIAVVCDKQTNAAQLTSQLVYTNPSGSSVLNADLFRNLEYIDRFKVLKVFRCSFESPQAAYDGTNIETGGSSRPFSMNIDLKGMKTLFKGDSTPSTVADIVDNSLHVLAFKSSNQYTVNCYYNARLRFVG